MLGSLLDHNIAT